MITRVEIDGFKSFTDFSINVSPFLAVLGANAAGKSNFFDAIQFLRHVTEGGLATAVREARGDLEDLFRRRGDGTHVDKMQFAVEVLLDPQVRDQWGTQITLTQSRIRYELHIVRRQDSDGNERLFVDHESAVPLRRGARDVVALWGASRAFIDTHVPDGRRSSPFLETVVDADSRRVFKQHQDGAQGRPRPADAAETTVLANSSTADFRHLYALRQEVASWRFLQLEPHALREPSERYGEDRLEPDGGNLARVLQRIQRETTTEVRPEGSLADISAGLAALVPGVRGVRIVENSQTRRWEIQLDAEGEGTFRADVASDGTLRMLGLLAALYDPRYRGLICFEEPENGVHPLRLRTLIAYLRGLVTDPARGDGAPGPLSQVIVNSHSPVVLAAMTGAPAVYVDMQTLIETSPVTGQRVKSRVSRFRRVSDPRTDILFDVGLPPMAPSEVRRYQAAADLGEGA